MLKKLDVSAYFIKKTNICKRRFYENRCMYFLIKDKKIWKKYNEIWKKVSNIIKKEFDSKLVHNKKCLKINTKKGSQCFCTPVILIDSFYRKDKN